MDGREQAESLAFRRCPDLPGLELLQARRSSRLMTLFHETYTFCLVRQGVCEYLYRGRLNVGPTGELSAMEPGEVHVTRRIYSPGSYDVLFVAPSAIEALAVDLGMRTRRPHLRLAQLGHRGVAGEVARLVASLSGKATLLERETRPVGALRSLLVACGEESPREGAPRAGLSALRRVRSMLIDRAAERLSLEDLSRESGLSRWHLVREFRAWEGVPPHRFQIQVRLARARDLLAGGASAIETSTALGFADQSHFHRHFKRLYHMTPGQFVRRIHGG